MDTFYTDHWQTIEPERLDRYEQMFQFRPELEPFVDALALTGKTSVLDFGCGPGFMAEEIASRTTAQVFGVDLNKEFMSRAQARNTKDNLNFFHLAGDALPDEINAVDRVFIKNVLEYVPDLEGTVARLHEILGDGGRIVVDLPPCLDHFARRRSDDVCDELEDHGEHHGSDDSGQRSQSVSQHEAFLGGGWSRAIGSYRLGARP